MNTFTDDQLRELVRESMVLASLKSSMGESQEDVIENIAFMYELLTNLGAESEKLSQIAQEVASDLKEVGLDNIEDAAISNRYN